TRAVAAGALATGRPAAGACRFVVPGDEAQPAGRLVADKTGVLLVEDQSGRVFPGDHVTDLRAGEPGVQVEGARPELRAGDGRLDEAPVVAAEDPDPVALADAGRPHTAGEGVGSPVELPDGQRPQLVVDRDRR